MAYEHGINIDEIASRVDDEMEDFGAYDLSDEDLRDMDDGLNTDHFQDGDY